jgi:hypothetical protein
MVNARAGSRYPTAEDLDPEDRAEASAVLAALHVGCGEGGTVLLAVHEILERLRERARRQQRTR